MAVARTLETKGIYARFSETLGYGVRDGNAIRFVFEYPDGPFRTTYQWSPEKDTWQWLMTKHIFLANAAFWLLFVHT
jgi:hypothetical protein